MDNPFKIKPGEKLILIQVLDRYLDWNRWNEENKRWERKERCDTGLYSAYLCCNDHMAISAESHSFFAYLHHLTFDDLVFGHPGFSMNSMRAFIRNHHLEVSAQKIALYFGDTEAEWEEFMRE